MEWAPSAKAMYIFGEFNEWKRGEYWCSKNEFGCFVLTIKALPDGTPRMKHGQKYKLHLEGADGAWVDRNSAWAHQHLQNSHNLFDSVFWNPPEAEKFKWTYPDAVKPKRVESIRIYESHVGMAQEGGSVGSYRDYADIILPRVKEAGYNVI